MRWWVALCATSSTLPLTSFGAFYCRLRMVGSRMSLTCRGFSVLFDREAAHWMTTSELEILHSAIFSSCYIYFKASVS